MAKAIQNDDKLEEDLKKVVFTSGDLGLNPLLGLVVNMHDNITTPEIPVYVEHKYALNKKRTYELHSTNSNLIKDVLQ